MTRSSRLLLLAFALGLPSAASAQDLGLRPPTDIYFFASPDPLTQSVLRSQVADRASGGVVSAVLRKAKGEAADPTLVDYQGLATPADTLKLPASAIGRRAAAYGAEGAPGSAPPKGGLPSKFVKRSIAASQLLSIVESMRSKAHPQRVAKSTP